MATFEPAFVDELAAIFRFSFDYIQRSGETEPDEVTWLRDSVGGSVYLRLSTRSIERLNRKIAPDLSRDIVSGGYWIRKPGPNADVVVVYTGAVAPEAIEAVGLIGEDRRDVGLLAVTSADRLSAGWTAAQRAREHGLIHARSHVERLLGQVPPHCALITVVDGHPATLAWMDQSTVIARGRSVSNISGRPELSPISIGIMASMHRELHALQKRPRAAGR